MSGYPTNTQILTLYEWPCVVLMGLGMIESLEGIQFSRESQTVTNDKRFGKTKKQMIIFLKTEITNEKH